MAGWSGEEYHFRKATEQQPERAVGNEAGKEVKEKSWPDLEVGDPWIELMEGIIKSFRALGWCQCWRLIPRLPERWLEEVNARDL